MSEPSGVDSEVALGRGSGRGPGRGPVVFFVHPTRPDAADLADELAGWLRRRQVAVLDGVQVAAPSELAGAQLVVSLGGDGTMLRAVEAALGLGVPVLGVNLGRLGYLTEVEPDGALDALERWLSGEAGIEERMTLAVSVDAPTRAEGGPPISAVALNEAVLDRGCSGHTVRVRVVVSGEPFLSYAADAVIVATPTGSTAYNLSARGPVLAPSLDAIVVTPVSPHTLFDRSLVLGPDEEVRLEVVAAAGAGVRVDGAAIAELSVGDAVVVRRSRRRARLVRLARRDFKAVIRAKFGLASR